MLHTLTQDEFIQRDRATFSSENVVSFIQGCRGYGYPWINPYINGFINVWISDLGYTLWIYPWIFLSHLN